MALSSILILTGIVAAFGLFAIVLAWGERQTRNLARNEVAADQDEHVERLKKAA